MISVSILLKKRKCGKFLGYRIGGDVVAISVSRSLIREMDFAATVLYSVSTDDPWDDSAQDLHMGYDLPNR